MGYNDPKVGEIISKWDMVEPYKCTESGPTEGGKSSRPLIGESASELLMDKPGNANTSERVADTSPNGDNPGLSFDASLPDQGDQRVKTGGSNSAIPGTMVNV